MSLTYLEANHGHASPIVRKRSISWAAVLILASIQGCGGGGAPTTVTTPAPSTPTPAPAPAPPSAITDSCSTSPLASFAFANTTVSLELGEATDLVPQSQLASGCTAPTQYRLLGSLPTGLSFDASTGRISGVAANGGQSTLSVRALGASGPTATVSIAVTPLNGTSTQALTAQRVLSSLPALQGPQLAAMDASASPTLLLMGKNPLSQQMEYWRSSDAGASWTQLTAPNSPQSRGPSLASNQFRLTQGDGSFLVLDAGGSSRTSYSNETGTTLNDVYDIPARLYQFNGSQWSLINSVLPQVWNGAAFYSSGSNVHIVFERPQQRAFEQSTDLGVSFSTYSSLDSDLRSDLPANAGHCGGYANGYYFYQPGQASTQISRFLVRGDLNGAVPSNWVSSNASFNMANFVTTTYACATWNNRFWIASKSPGQQTLTLLSASSSDAIDYPRRYPNTPTFVHLAPAGNRLLGISVNANGIADQLWGLTP
jgi:Putative Ig domain